MGRYEKLIAKLLNPSVVFTSTELIYILNVLGYNKKRSGKTSGSRITFYNEKLNHLIRLHKPHPSNDIKWYVKKYIVKELQRLGLI